MVTKWRDLQSHRGRERKRDKFLNTETRNRENEISSACVSSQLNLIMTRQCLRYFYLKIGRKTNTQRTHLLIDGQ